MDNEELRPCPFCGVDIEEACPMDDGTAVCYHRHTEGGCILDGMWFPQDKWNTRTTPTDGLREALIEAREIIYHYRHRELAGVRRRLRR